MEHDYETNQRDQLSKTLAWFSIALGASELAAPQMMRRLAGLPESSEPVLRALGAREIAHGISIFARPDSPVPVWTRVAGDAIDLAVLFSALGSEDSDRGRVSAAIAAVAGVTALDVF